MNNQLTSNDKKNNFALNLGLFSNIILALVKVTAGITGNSSALLADGINSTSDVVYYIAAKFFLKISIKPPDKEHPYGHRQMENIAAIVIGAFILTTAIAIFWNSINNVYDILINHSPAIKAGEITLIIAISTIGIKIILTLITQRIGKITKNSAIKAFAYDHLNDVFAALAAAIGITFNMYGLYWVDPFAGAIVAIFIFKTGMEIIKESANSIMDMTPDNDFKNKIIELALKTEEEITIEKIITHKFGQYIVANITVALDGDLSIKKGNEISDELELILIKNIDELVDVHIHYHPGK